MNWRTPSSLKWLITKHSRLQGELLRLKEDAAQLQEKIAEKEATLDGLERVLSLHELKIAPDDIAAVLPQRNRWLMKPGEMTSRIYDVLKAHGEWMQTGDRDRVSLRDIGAFPFYTPERHPQPDRAQAIVRQVAQVSRELERSPSLRREHDWLQRKPQLDALIEDYFGLEGETRAIVRESVDILRPMVRPYGLSKVFLNASYRVDDAMASRYAASLKSELEAWRDARAGEGEFQVNVRLTNVERAGAFGIVAVRVGDSLDSEVSSERSDLAVDGLVRAMYEAGLLPIQAREEIYLAADTIIVSGDTVYYIKPQAQRLWLLRQAHRDAERIVRTTLKPTSQSQEAA